MTNKQRCTLYIERWGVYQWPTTTSQNRSQEIQQIVGFQLHVTCFQRTLLTILTFSGTAGIFIEQMEVASAIQA